MALGANNKANSTAPTVTVPAGCAIGDAFVLVLTQNNTDVVTATPAGLSQVDFNTTIPTFPNRLYVGVVDGTVISPGSVLTWTLSASRQWSLDMVAWSGLDPNFPLAHYAIAASADAVEVTPTVVTSIPTRLVEVVSGKSNGTAITSWTAPSGWTGQQTAAAAGTFAGSSVIADWNTYPAPAGTYGGDTYTPSSAPVGAVRYSLGLRLAPTPVTKSLQLVSGVKQAVPTSRSLVFNARQAVALARSLVFSVAHQPALVGTPATGSGASAANQNITYAGTVGNTLVLIYNRSGGLATGALTSVTDTGGNTWTRATRGTVSGVSNTRQEVWVAQLTASPGTITCASGTAQTNSWELQEWSGLSGQISGASPDNSFSPASGTSTTITAPSIACAVGDVLIAASHFSLSTTSALTAGWTATPNFDDSTVGSGRAAWQLATGTSSGTASWTLGTARQAGVSMVALTAGAPVSSVALTRQLVFAVLAQVPDSVTLRFSTLQAVPDAVTLLFNDTVSVGAARSLLWTDRAVVGLADSLLWSGRAQVPAAAQLLYGVRTVVPPGSLSLPWADLAPVATARQLLYGVRAVVGASRGLVWSGGGTLSLSLSLPFAVRQLVAGSVGLPFRDASAVALSRILLHNVRQAVQTSRSLVFADRAVLTASETLRWQGLTGLGAALSLPWGDRARLTVPADLRWGLLSSLGLGRSLVWAQRAALMTTRSLPWTDLAVLSSAGALSWPVRRAVPIAAQLPWTDLARVPTTGLSLLWDADGQVLLSLTAQWAALAPVGLLADLRWALRNRTLDADPVMFRMGNLQGMMVMPGLTGIAVIITPFGTTVLHGALPRATMRLEN